MEKSNPELFKALKLSHDLAFRFASKQRESFVIFEMNFRLDCSPAKNIPVDCAGLTFQQDASSSFFRDMTLTPAAAAGVKKIVFMQPLEFTQMIWKKQNFQALAFQENLS